LSRSILDALERLCLVEELLTKLLSLPKAADCYLLDVSLSIFQVLQLPEYDDRLVSSLSSLS